ncbi:MAG: lactoylglutathione lyase [Deltaproteobacteria bacterium]|nr:MAG: lactoylglutathione lyase [Deltaproteobacteria bacterium]
MKYLHTMIRVKDLDRALDFFVEKLGLVETRRHEVPEGKFTLVFLATAQGEPEVELTYNWGQEDEYSFGRNFGHLAYAVDDINKKCSELMEKGVDILRPPRDGRMAFIKSPDNISVELLQKGEALTPCEPWISMENKGSW